MTVRSASYTIYSASATPIVIGDTDINDGITIWLYGEYHGSNKKIAIGGSDVTLTNGIHIYAAEKFGPIGLGKGETLYAISDEATGLDLRVFATRA